MPKKSACVVCEKEVHNIKRHLIKVHSAGLKFASEACAKIVESRKAGNGSLRCTICNKKYLDLSLHLLRSHPDMSKRARAATVREAKNWDSQESDGQLSDAATADDTGTTAPHEVPSSGTDESDREASQEASEASEHSGGESSQDAAGRSDISTQGSDGDSHSSGREWPEIPAVIDRYQEWLQTFAGGKMEKDHSSAK